MSYDDWKLATPPEDNEPKEPSRCEECDEIFEDGELFNHFVNLKPYLVCSECLHNLHQNL